MCLWKNKINKGIKFEKKVAKKVGRKINILSKNKTYYKNNKRYCETDIETNHCAIEVKSGKGNDLKKQLDKYSLVTHKEPIGYAPYMSNGSKKYVRKYYSLFDDIKTLIKYFIQKGDGKKRKKGRK